MDSKLVLWKTRARLSFIIGRLSITRIVPLSVYSINPCIRAHIYFVTSFCAMLRLRELYTTNWFERRQANKCADRFPFPNWPRVYHFPSENRKERGKEIETRRKLLGFAERNEYLGENGKLSPEEERPRSELGVAREELLGTFELLVVARQGVHISS